MVKIENYEVFFCAEKGRGLRAINNIDPGEDVLTEKPIVCTLTNSKCRGVRCDFCFTESEKLSKCSKCKFVFYCDKTCQTDDWPVHKRECGHLVKVSPKQPPDICRLVSHLLFKYYWKNNQNINRQEVDSLKSNVEHITNVRKEAFFTFGGVLHEYLQGSSINMQEADTFGLFCKVSCNSFTITNEELNPIGTGVFKTASLINHSCNPNCYALFNGPNICIRSIKKISAGEELTVSYVDLLVLTEQRRADLKDGFMFDCTCEVCSGEQLNDFLMNSIKCGNTSCDCLIVSSSDKSCSCDKNCGSSSDRISIATSCVDDLNAVYNEVKVIPTGEQQKKLNTLIERGENILGPANISLVHCYEVAMDGCLQREEWKKALEYSLKLETAYQKYLTKYHPTIGLHHFKIGKLQSLLNELRAAFDSLQKAHRALSVSHGDNHSLVRKLKDTLAELSYELVQEESYCKMEE